MLPSRLTCTPKNLVPSSSEALWSLPSESVPDVRSSYSSQPELWLFAGHVVAHSDSGVMVVLKVQSVLFSAATTETCAF